MIPPDYQAVAVRLARLGRNDAYALCEAAISAKVPALDLLCQHLDATLARYKALPALSLSNGPTCTSTAALPALSLSNGPNCASTPKMPAKAATPAQAPAKRDPAPSVATPADVGHVAGTGKHGADDAAKRAALRAAMAEGPNSPTNEPNSPTNEPNSPTNEPNSPTNEPNSPTNEPLPDTVIEPEQAPIHQLPSRGGMGEVFMDAQAALTGLGWSKTEARRMAKAAVEAGAADVEAVIRACTRKAK